MGKLKVYPVIKCIVCGAIYQSSYKHRITCSIVCKEKRIKANSLISHTKARLRFKSNFYKNKLWLTQKYTLGFNKEKGYKMAGFGWVNIPEHRVIFMRELGRELRSWEHIHHVNGIKTDNRRENLTLIVNKQHFTVTMAMNENKELRNRIIALEEDIRNLKTRYKLQEVS
jgi:hypothetical protein